MEWIKILLTAIVLHLAVVEILLDRMARSCQSDGAYQTPKVLTVSVWCGAITAILNILSIVFG